MKEFIIFGDFLAVIAILYFGYKSAGLMYNMYRYSDPYELFILNSQGMDYDQKKAVKLLKYSVFYIVLAILWLVLV